MVHTLAERKRKYSVLCQIISHVTNFVGMFYMIIFLHATVYYKRHKSNDGFAASLGEMAQSLKKLIDSSHVYMEKMATAISVDPKSEQGLKVVAELQTIEDLDLDDLIAASNLIIGNASNESLLFTLQGAQKKRMVLKLIGKAPART